MILPRLLAAATALSLLAVPVAAATPPVVGVASFDQMARPPATPYDTSADADAQVAAALKRARAHGKLLLIDLGGNWCPDCRILAGVMALPTVHAFVARHYEVVMVDVGRMDRNLQIPARYGVTALNGVPAVLVVDPRRDRLIDAAHIFALADARTMSPQGLADWLAQWV